MKKFILLFLFVFLFATQAFAFHGVKWQFKAPVTSNITVNQNNVFFGDGLGVFYTLNKNSGSLIWKYNDEGTIIGSPAVIDGKVIFAKADGGITCLNLADGSLVWNYAPSENENDSISDGVTAGGDLAFISKADAKLYAIDINTGRTVWTFQAGEQGLRTAPAYADNLVFLGEYNGIFNIIDAKTGKRLNGGGAGGAINTPAVNNGNVYFSAWDGSVQAVKIKSVIPLWNVNIKDTVTTAPVIADGIIAVGTGRGAVAALDEKDGSILWQFNCEKGSVSANPIIANGKVFAFPEGGNIYEFDAKSGRLRNTFETDGNITNPAYSEGVIYFSSGGNVCALSE